MYALYRRFYFYSGPGTPLSSSLNGITHVRMQKSILQILYRSPSRLNLLNVLALLEEDA